MVLGPGGSGVSAVAAAAASQRPSTPRDSRQAVTRPEQHTLLITVDRWSPVHDWARVYRQPGEPVAVSKFLHLLTLDRLDLTERTWSAFIDVLEHTAGRSKAVLPGVGTLSGIDAAELTSLPGIDDFLLLRRIRDEATSGRWQRIIVDLSGCGDPLQFLRGGSVLSQALNRFWPRHRRLATASERPVMAPLTAAVDAIDRDCADVAELFSDAHAVAVHLVLGADDRARRLAEHYVAGADVMGLPLASVQVNRGVGSESPEDLAAHVEGMLDGPGGSRDVRVVLVERSAETIDRVARLRKLAVRLPDPHGVARGSAASVVEPVAGTETAFRLSWPQRLPEPDSLALGRSGDDLLVTISGFRHPVRLPSVLRRCIVVDAAWEDGRLTVGFVPDPAVWPRR
ncbi:chromosome partitioning protein ParA [Gordonia sp. CNJ-863]|uniref:ArsA-related P-loop ATPase n=1 Tax=Gordonia TaxID=2053 RepID=UPI00095DFE75|nr:MULTISPECIES: ArsA-related P-loop ATPase [Gordonia]MDH3022717.1 ArsA-related P-loop ATPase [Gordonia alkanivorans]MDH3049840.1 ArsA-related P-loop ATPase [Gordonia alkanivorans]MDJ0009616.1 ArsA-related P-loop ATPase [Gordonia alkanivorans]MDJ0028257.1 ArsA-related P-loop ATPase [Gordonia alkanivorans]MDJ0099337.1 ArsA-related P-loop ATPase [Gordonia alkanivorans]